MAKAHVHDKDGGEEGSTPLLDVTTGDHIGDLKTYRCSCGAAWQSSAG